MHVTGIFAAREDQDLIERTVGGDLMGDCQKGLPAAGCACKIYRKYGGPIFIVGVSGHSFIL
jgi:hypothetical protein